MIAIGRSSIDLYSNDIGAPFEDITTFKAYVGGSPTNIAVGCRRLGLSSALLTAFGDDKVADFIKKFLKDEDVDFSYCPTVPHCRTSAVLLGVQPPDTFPLVYYRDNAADIQITSEVIDNIDFSQIKIVEISGTALSREPSRGSVIRAGVLAKQSQCQLILDLDFRQDQWISIDEYRDTLAEICPLANIIVGTKEEFLVASDQEDTEIIIDNQQMSNPKVFGQIEKSISYFSSLTDADLIVKNGAEGCNIYTPLCARQQNISGFTVKVQNVLGAGDAFTAGLIYGLAQKWTLEKSARFANACGAIMVTKHGCANFMPTYDEVIKFIENHGGW